MRTILNAAMLLCALGALLMHAPVANAEPKDWENGKNTWQSTHKGDWVTYSIGGSISTRYEVTGVDPGPKITYKFENFDSNGNTLLSKQYTKDWKVIKLNGRLPHKLEVKWDKAEYEVGGVTVECDTASWEQTDAGILTTQSVWYSKDVACGGVVKQTTNGKDMVWLTGFKSKESALDTGKAGAGDKADTPDAGKATLPKFFRTVGNTARYKAGIGSVITWQQHTVKEVKDNKATYTVQFCSESGSALPGRAPREMTITAEEWGKDREKPAETGVKLKAGDEEYTCDVYKYTKDTTEVQEWVSDGTLIKRVETTGDTTKTLELAKLEMK
jgi:hypothetical protein